MQAETEAGRLDTAIDRASDGEKTGRVRPLLHPWSIVALRISGTSALFLKRSGLKRADGHWWFSIGDLEG
ncbi:MAG TPA: hypothetical protein VKB47_14525 [Terracidiphilus sp.]|nr:hypothetical protein [Terracidiphilus sp.]